MATDKATSETEEKTVYFPSESAMEAEAAYLAQEIASPCCITLEGNLGTGKTSFARAFIRALMGNVEVVSPTFTLVQQYDSPKGVVLHWDLYRLEHEDELLELGFTEGVDSAITLIEWPAIAERYLPEKVITIALSHPEDGREGRIMTMKKRI